MANYAYLDTKVTRESRPDVVGNRFLGIPFNTANVWTRYNLIQDTCQTLGAALGLVYVGDREGDLENTFALPAYARWDAGFYYRRGRFGLSVYLENLFDRQYYTGSVSALQVVPGTPFNARASLRWNF